MSESRAKGKGWAGSARCPICGAPSEPDVRPFCSKRCADIDLARWMNGVYVIPGNVDDDEDGDLGVGAGAGHTLPRDDEPGH